MNTLIIKYGELTTKKNNRSFFIKTLKQNINKHLTGFDYQLITNHSFGIIKADQDTEVIIERLQNVFGIHAIIKVKQIEKDFNVLNEACLAFIKSLNIKTFKINTKRSDKNLPMTSLEINGSVASYILKHTDLTVDVHNPDLLLKVEAREDGFYIYESYYQGLGGYPVGIQGKAVVMLSGGIDSPVALFMAMKRGIKCLPIYFDSPPHTTEMAHDKVEKLVSILQKYDPDLKLTTIQFTKIQEAIYQNCKHDYLITIMRRMMFRIANWYAVRKKAKIIVTGESIGQVASQTLDSINVINAVVKMPIIRPLACFDKLEIIKLAKQIGTYETSILPYEDCCTIFVPKHPVIHPKLKTCEEYEQNFDYQALIKDIF